MKSGESKVFSKNKTLQVGGRLIDLSEPKVMGVINVTPDSFYSGSRAEDESHILEAVEKNLEEGASFIDVGGYSSRPGAEDVPLAEELSRVIPAIKAITKSFPEAIISVDTFRSEVARIAVCEGAGLINDISAGSLDEKMLSVIASLQVPYILMHMKGNPRTMVKQVQYENMIGEIAQYFHQKVEMLRQLNVKDIILDPGFGFAKTVEQNFRLLHQLDYFNILEKPLLVGLSRKSMIWRTLEIEPDEALNGTTALNTIALIKGASILRVHDVKEAVQVIKLLSRLPHQS